MISTFYKTIKQSSKCNTYNIEVYLISYCAYNYAIISHTIYCSRNLYWQPLWDQLKWTCQLLGWIYVNYTAIHANGGAIRNNPSIEYVKNIRRILHRFHENIIYDGRGGAFMYIKWNQKFTRNIFPLIIRI